jgi:hypothetical protein
MNLSLTWWIINSPLTLPSFDWFCSSSAFCFVSWRQNFFRPGYNGKRGRITYVHSILVPLYSTSNFTFSSCRDLRFFCKDQCSVTTMHCFIGHCKEGFVTSWFLPHLIWATSCHRAAWGSASSSVASPASPVQAPKGPVALSQHVPSLV